MSILTFDDYIASVKQLALLKKTASRTTIAAMWFSLFELAGNPGAGTLAGTSTAAGVVPTDATAGCPTINDFGAGALGYLSRVMFSNSVACRLRLCDLLWKGGAYSYNANVSLTGQPSFSSRLPTFNSAPDYRGLEIWVETVTAATGNQTWNVTYTNQSGIGSKSTGAVGIGAAPTVGRMWQLPLAVGDSGVQKIDNVVGGTGSAGTANILILRPLWEGNLRVANAGDIHGIDRTGMPQVFQDSAMYLMLAADSTSSGVPDVMLEIANK